MGVWGGGSGNYWKSVYIASVIWLEDTIFNKSLWTTRTLQDEASWKFTYKMIDINAFHSIGDLLHCIVMFGLQFYLIEL